MTDKHRLTEELLGKEIGSLVSGRVESVSPPAGIFLAIQDRLGTQDTDWSPVRLIGKLVPGAWRLPVNTGRIVKITAGVIAAIVIASILVLQGSDSDQEDTQPAAEPTATVAPLPTATSIPEPTATQEPAEPTSTPEPVAETNAAGQTAEEIIAETQALVAIDFPEELSSEVDRADRLDRDAVRAAYEEYLTGTRIYYDAGPRQRNIYEFCSGGSGTLILAFEGPEFWDQPFDWSLANSPGGSWNEVKIVWKLHDEVLHQNRLQSGQLPEAGVSFAFNAPNLDTNLPASLRGDHLAYVSSSCG